MSWAALIGTIVTAVVGPLLAYFIKRWLSKKSEAAATAKRQAEEAEAAKANNQKVGEQAGAINGSIDAQKAAREEWAKKNPPPGA